MKKFKKLQIWFCILPALWIFSAYAKPKQAGKQIPPLTLQWEASHSTGLHQISLIFRKDRVDLFTNTSLWQDARSPRLGHFTSLLNEKWQIERERIGAYLSLLKERPPVNTKDSLLNGNFPKGVLNLIQKNPHAPIIRLNGYEMREKNSYFPALKGVFPLLWKNQWSCTDCVVYRVHPKKGIKRQRISKSENTSKALFSREQMRCYSINKKLLECADTHGGPTGNGWGSFRISLHSKTAQR